MSQNISIKRQERAKRNVTGTMPGVKDRKCINQEIYDDGVWPSGQQMQRVKYLHITKGWRDRLLPPLHTKQLNLIVR